MKQNVLSRASAAAALVLTLAFSLSAQTTTVDSVVGSDGRLVPSASGILNPHVTEGRFGTSIQGGYFGPSPNRPESRFSSNALFDYSGRFIGIVGDADAERADLAERASQDEDLSDIDKLMIMRYMRRQAMAQQEGETPPLLQRSAGPPAEQLPSPAGPATETAAVPTEPAPAAPQPNEPAPAEETPPAPPAEQIWMRGSSRYTNTAPSQGMIPPVPNDSPMIDPRWYEFGADAPAPSGPTAQNPPAPQDVPADVPFEEGMVIGGRLPDAEPARINPSEALARNGRQEQTRSAAAAQQLETRLLQSPLVSPLAPIRVRLNGTTAVVTGIVGSDAARLEAGKILLEDRRIETVDNRIVVYSDDLSNEEAPAENRSADSPSGQPDEIPPQEGAGAE